jgi:hypothetical protein
MVQDNTEAASGYRNKLSGTSAQFGKKHSGRHFFVFQNCHNLKALRFSCLFMIWVQHPTPLMFQGILKNQTSLQEVRMDVQFRDDVVDKHSG